MLGAVGAWRRSPVAAATVIDEQDLETKLSSYLQLEFGARVERCPARADQSGEKGRSSPARLGVKSGDHPRTARRTMMAGYRLGVDAKGGCQQAGVSVTAAG